METSTKNSRSRPTLIILAVLAVIMMLGLVYWLFIRDEQSPEINPQTTESSQNETTTNNNATEQNQTPKTYSIKAFFSKDPESNDSPDYAVSVDRTCSDVGVAKCAINELLKGPTESEKAKGYFTPLKISGDSNCNGQDFTISIKDGFAKLQFCRNIELTGVLADARIKTVIDKSLLQFETIKKVAILDKNGNCALDLTGENRCLQ